jgi:DNA-binding MarR family transcriptional regulator
MHEPKPQCPQFRSILEQYLSIIYYTKDKKTNLEPLLKNKRNHDIAILSLVYLKQPINMTALKNLLLCSSRTFDACVIKLHELGFLIISDSKEDKRTKLLRITPHTYASLSKFIHGIYNF